MENSGAANAALSTALYLEANELLESCRESVNLAKIDVEKVANQADLVAEQLSVAEESVEDASLHMTIYNCRLRNWENQIQINDRTALAEDFAKHNLQKRNSLMNATAVNNRLQDAERKLSAARTELDKRSGSNGMAPVLQR